MSPRIIVILATIAFVSASPAERQTCLRPRPIPLECMSAYTQTLRIIGVAIAAPALVSKQQAINQTRSLLDNFCTSNCLEPAAANLTCVGQQNIANFVLTGICAKEGGEFCPIVALRANISGSPLTPTCARPGIACDSSCRQSLITLQTRLGCCAGSWYNNTGSIVGAFLSQFTMCGVNLGERCAPAIGAGSTTALCMSALLLFAVSALAIVF